MAACLFALCGCCGGQGIDINVKKNLKTNLDKYKTVYINLQTLCGSSTGSYINVELHSIFDNRGMSISYGDTPPSHLKVECVFRSSIGCLHIGRHFNIEFVHTTVVNIKLIDVKTNETIGEVECKRPCFKRLPPGYVRLMFDRLLASGPPK